MRLRYSCNSSQATWRQTIPGRRERHAWNVYIMTDNVKALYDEYSALPGLKISRQLSAQDYGMMEFDVMDLNGHRLVFAQPMPAR